jgi:hypothetical protein
VSDGEVSDGEVSDGEVSDGEVATARSSLCRYAMFTGKREMRVCLTLLTNYYGSGDTGTPPINIASITPIPLGGAGVIFGGGRCIASRNPVGGCTLDALDGGLKRWDLTVACLSVLSIGQIREVGATRAICPIRWRETPPLTPPLTTFRATCAICRKQPSPGRITADAVPHTTYQTRAVDGNREESRANIHSHVFSVVASHHPSSIIHQPRYLIIIYRNNKYPPGT